MSIGMWIYFQVFCLIPLTNVSAFVPIYYYYSVEQFEIRDDNTSSTPFIIQDCICVFPYEAESENCTFKFCKESCQNFDRDSNESLHYFWQAGHSYFINPTDPLTGPSFHLLRSSSVSFLNILEVFFFTCLVIITSRFFFFF